jgi:hypothetical protein
METENNTEIKPEAGSAKIPVQRFVIFSRWLLFVPAGIFEILLALLAGVTVTLHYVCSVTLDVAYKLPSIDWYCGGKYVRRNAPNGNPISNDRR